MLYQHFVTGIIFTATLLSACSSVTPENQSSPANTSSQNSDNFLIVDCLLPGQVRKLGGQFSYITAKRPIKTSASHCSIRGGEYVAYDRADYATALKIWLPLAKEGDAEAQAYIGEIYEKGLGIVPDYELAAYWYRKASDQQFTRAQINLGHLYEKGLGVKKNIATAMEYYRMASGLTSDQLTFSSSIQASYVPREQFQAVSQQLRQTESKQVALESKIDDFETLLNNKNKNLSESQKQLDRTQQQLQALLISTPKQASGVSTDRELQLLSELKDLEQQRVKLLSQVAVIEDATKMLTAENKALQSQLQKSIDSESKYKAQIAQTQMDLDSYATQLQNTQYEVAELEQSLLAHKTSNNTASASGEKTIAELERSIEKKNAILMVQQQQHDSLLAQHSAEKQALSKMRSQLKNQQEVLAKYSAESTAQAKHYKTEMIKKEQSLEALRNQLMIHQQQLQVALDDKQKEIDALAVSHQSETGEYESKISDLASQLAQQQQLVDTQQQQISILQKDIDDYNLEIIKVASLVPTAAGPNIDDAPSIEIIDPPVTLTRSTPTVNLRTQQNYRDIIGKVSAPAGLLSLTINGINEDLEDNSLFKAEIPIKDEVTPVDIVAIDTKGRRVSLSFSMLSDRKTKTSNQTVKKQKGEVNRPKLGNYYALIIGNNNYQSMSTLVTAINDAKETERVLRNQYQFKTQLLLNATRYQILSALNKLREDLQEEDNLLIYYAGHGKLDSINKRGFWLPVDADENNSANWISNIAITDILNAMKAKHVLVVADSCYSGSFSQAAIARVEQDLDDNIKQQWINVMANTRARIMLTSGGVEPVLDGGGGKHSIFAKAFLDTLRDNNQILEGYSLYYEVLTKVMKKASQLDREQVPQYAPIHLAGHESGEFLFSPKI